MIDTIGVTQQINAVRRTVGKRFMRLSGDRWREAHVASGSDEAGARAMAGRTIAAYAGSTDGPSG